MVECILIADGVPADRRAIAAWLEHAGYRVVEAGTGAAALAAVRQRPPDLVLLDVRLPDMDGFAVCERIKAENTALPVIHLAASASPLGERTQGLTRGADGYLLEPIEPEVLLATVHAMLRYARARRRAERLAARLAGLSDATLAVNAATNLDDLLTAAAGGATAIFGRPAAVLAAVPHGDQVRYARDDGEARTAPAPLGEVARGVTVTTRPAGDWAHLLPSAQGQVRLAVARVQSRPPAAILIDADAMAEDEDLHVLSQLAQSVALAVEGLRSLDEERRIALTLQRSLLPRSLPAVPGLELAARYVPASAEAEIGGDFYELIELDGRLLVAVGDVLGHSLHAATVMAEIRHAVRAYAAEGHSPGEVLRQVNRLMLRFLPRELATVTLLLLDPATGETVLGNAGHLPPLLIAEGRAEYLTLPGPLLGADLPRPAESRLTLPPGGVLLLVTDGLVERRDLSLPDGLARLRTLAADPEPDLDAFCDRLLADLMWPGHEDDIALVALRRSRSRPGTSAGS
ncbi:fused response regulator/phosphatase [Acrocarpospora catenulata]|uniref:fused response regulator/phosphatase n=1 Tax=Acrocarpospora catenulata TaxID=2836182 RepID=UPI001BDA35E9|nr:fused response regulator/phosphatase [Acrocarpospora catenulata]